jgi:large subunit ribosomal protein L10
VVEDVGKHIARAQTLALAEYRGLTVDHLNTLRRQARDKGVYLHVLKNSLARRAVAGTTFEVARDAMVGPLIYGFSDDAVAAAKVISDFARGNDKLVVKGGVYAGKALDANGVKALAAIPSREVLIAQVAGLLRSPIQRLAGVLAAVAESRGAGETTTGAAA